ncbi:biotin--[acetyl-CoA-carboxylase] ligase [Halobacterium bonnevillei]|uniref:biotin--[acetyl-CoA-carboxylase] ligase n=1 Tax=Halobacterium bonnevillei TaxID=2692200 RepID=UPI001F3F916B|nr:hypothetical protein [Halobacterium bonnevillei]
MSVDIDRLRERIDAPVVHHESIPSTNDVARAEGRDGSPHGTFVVADEQTAGRGRTGNVWASPPGGVWSSTLVRPDFDASHVADSRSRAASPPPKPSRRSAWTRD